METTIIGQSADEEILTLFHAVCLIAGFLIGAALGSGAVCFIYRRKGHESWLIPSHCDSCGHKLSIIDLLPIIGYIIRGGKCHYCGEHLPPNYLLSEVSFGMMGTIVAISCFSAAMPITLRMSFIVLSIFGAALYLVLISKQAKFH